MITSKMLFTSCSFGVIATATVCLSLAGCAGEDDGPNPKPPPGAHVHGDHDHGAAGEHTHDDGSAHDHDTGDAHEHGDGHDHDHDIADAHEHGDGHDHDHDTGDAHEHGDGDDHDIGDAHEHGGTYSVSGDAFGGRALRVEVGGGLKPGSQLHVEGEVVSGPATEVLRVWVGDASGVGSMKARTDVLNGRFHVHVVVPAQPSARSHATPA